MKIRKFLFLIFSLCPIICLFSGCFGQQKEAYISGVNLNVKFDNSGCEDLDIEVGYRLEFVDNKYCEPYSSEDSYYGATPKTISGNMHLNTLCFEDLETAKNGYELKDMIIYFDINNYSEYPISLSMEATNDLSTAPFTIDCEQIAYIQEKDSVLDVKTQTAALRVRYKNDEDIKYVLNHIDLKISFEKLDLIADTEGVFTYTYNAENYTATVSSYTDASNELSVVKVPRKVVNETDGETYVVTELATGLFDENLVIKNIYLPDTTKKIGTAAFWGTKGLESVYMPDGIEEIGRQAFTNSTISGELYMPESLVKFSAIANSHMVYDDYYNYEGVAVFANCFNITKLVFSEGITKFPVQLLYCCSSLETLIVPTTLEEIVGYYYDDIIPRITGTFYGCSSLTELDLYNTSYKHGGYQTAFECTSLINAYLGKEQLNIGYGDFNSCTELVNVVVSNCLEAIDTAAFGSCEKLTTINFPDTLREIHYIAFQSCKKLEEIIIPKSVEFIGDFAFNHCTWAKNTVIKLPASIKQLGGKTYDPENPNRTRIGSHVFYNCATENLVAFEIPVTNQYYMTVDGVLYQKDNGVPTVLIAYPASKKDTVYVMPNTVVDAFELSMSRPYYLREIVLSDSFIIQDAIDDEETRCCLNESWANNFSAMLYTFNGVVKVTCNDTNPNYKSVNGQVYSKDGKILYFTSIFTENDGETLTFEDGVETIFKGAIAGDTNQNNNQNSENMKHPENFLYRYTNIVIPASVKNIDSTMIVSINDHRWNISVDPGNTVFEVNASGKLVQK